MGRPRISPEQRVTTAVRLPESLHRRLRAVATERCISANMLVTRAVTDYLDQLPSVAEALEPGVVGPGSVRPGSVGPEDESGLSTPQSEVSS